ncbi:CarD family transcriptional regulator [Neobacillus piezotolerans]|uniref:CarD family transcriptional regulator n=1 Tax=Neobacillus piezotolerans TaxID=2259171 RepID=A0A3D8GJI0_9BACI|nr:CarD family transcriptional regulator [Neobacillus piezotolerans]RDU34625.1 CarD family transcriptional regulator [Neobacillus piezotolerans]
MFSIGDFMIYSAHGICKVDDICEKTVSGITKTYYVLHPIDNYGDLTISSPVDNEKVNMLELMTQGEANELLESFRYPGLKWIENPNIRNRQYNDIVKTGNRKEIAKVVKTLMQKKLDAELHGKKLYESDRRLLDHIQHVLFKELAISLDTTVEEINEMVVKLVKLSTKKRMPV